MARQSIQQKIADLAQQFEQASNGLVSVTKPLSTFEYENGVYGALFVKPNKRLSKIFSTDREVLVLITKFSRSATTNDTGSEGATFRSTW